MDTPEGEACEQRASGIGEPVEWVTLVLRAADAASASLTLATELATRLGCERVSIGLFRRGRMHVEALSHSARFDPRTELVRELAAAMHEACDQDASLWHPARDERAPHVVRAHARLSELHGAHAVCSIPLTWNGVAIGAITLERADATPIDASILADLERIAALVGPALALRRKADARYVERARAQLHRLKTRLSSPGHPEARLGAALAVLLLAVATFLPGTHRIKADATLEGVVQRAIVAGLDGYVSEASARAGDPVRAGQVLARLDDRDLALEHRKWMAREKQLVREYRDALARHDRLERSLVQARLDEARAQVELLEGQRSRTVLVAPFDGIVVRGDLTQSLGSPVAKGDVLYEIAPADGYRIILEVDERDIADVSEGRPGGLALAARPGETLPMAIERVTPVSTAENGRNFFRVEASLAEPATSLRPGMEGVARIDVGRRRLIWIWTHDLVDWLRLLAWSWLP